MKQHRFYVPLLQLPAGKQVVLTDSQILHQWRKVLRFSVGKQVVLFNGKEEALYEIVRFDKQQAYLKPQAELKRLVPERQVWLAWSVLKKDKNDWVIQKGTEAGVSHFLPLQADNCEPSHVSNARLDRWQKICVEASEQCGRSDIPVIYEPLTVKEALMKLKTQVDITYIMEQNSASSARAHEHQRVAVCIGPEGGWSDSEKQLFKDEHIETFTISPFTLRAETAAIIASAQFLRANV